MESQVLLPGTVDGDESDGTIAPTIPKGVRVQSGESSESPRRNGMTATLESLFERQTERLCERLETILKRNDWIKSGCGDDGSERLSVNHPDRGRFCTLSQPTLTSSPKATRWSIPNLPRECLERGRAPSRVSADLEARDSLESAADWGSSHQEKPSRVTVSSLQSVDIGTIAAAIDEHRKQNAFQRKVAQFVENMFKHAALKEDVLDIVVVFVILSNAIILFLQTHLDDAVVVDGVVSETHESEEAHMTFLVIEHFFNIFFIFEVIVRFHLEGWKYLKDLFSIFDVLLVVATSTDMYVLEPFSLRPDGSSLGVSHLVRMFRCVRVLRVIRVVRFAKHMGQLKVIVSVLDGCLPTLFWSLVIIGLICLASGIFVAELLHGYIADPDQPVASRELIFEHYGNAARASYTLFEATFSGMWPLFARPLVDISGWWAVFWIWFELVIGFAVLQTIGAIFFSEMIKASNVASDLHTMSKLKDKDSYIHKLKIFFDAADTSGDGCLSKDELEMILENPTVQEYLQLMELEVQEVRGLFNLLDDRDDGSVELVEFLGGAVRLKGNARAVDSILMMHEQYRMKKQLDEMRSTVAMEQAAADRISIQHLD